MDLSFLPELAGGMLQTFIIFALTLVLSLPLGLVVYGGRVSRFSLAYSVLYLGDAGNPLNAATFGGVFRSLLPFRDANRSRLPFQRSNYRFRD